MSLPEGVTLLEEGRVKYYSQRVTRPPMADCMFAALCAPLSFVGYGIPESFVGELRKASGVPVTDASGKAQGTNTAASVVALHKLLPDAPIKVGGLDDETMLERLAAGEIVVRVMIRAEKLKPGRARKYVRGFKGLHAVAIGGARKRADDDDWEVLWMDPAGPKKGYKGQFVRYSKVKDALKRTPKGKVAVTFGEKDAALPRRRQAAAASNESTTDTSPHNGSPTVLTNALIDEFAVIPRGTPFLFPDTRKKATKARQDDQEYRLAGRTPNGKFAGVWVNTSRVPGASGLTLLLVEVSQIGKPFIRTTPPR
jgi:hypothetical protein